MHSGASAQRAAEAGTDFLVSQGTDAGDRTGSAGTMPLLQRVLQIGEAIGSHPCRRRLGDRQGDGRSSRDGRGRCLRRHTLLSDRGARGQRRGTKQRILEADETQTVHTHVFDIVQGFPWPGRVSGHSPHQQRLHAEVGREGERAGSAVSHASWELKGSAETRRLLGGGSLRWVGGRAGVGSPFDERASPKALHRRGGVLEGALLCSAGIYRRIPPVHRGERYPSREA